MKTIVQKDDPVLRKKARSLPERMFGSEELATLVAEMAEALDAEPDGVALAAPQIGVSSQLFIVRKDRTLPPLKPEKEGEAPPIRPAEVEVYVNPEIVKKSRRTQITDEGCLSVRGMYGTVKRHERVTLKAQKQDGSHVERGAGGLMAQIFEHEMDHLNGKLFVDHAESLVELKPHGLA